MEEIDPAPNDANSSSVAVDETIYDPRPEDVLCGQDRNYAQHPGTRLFNDLIKKLTPKYASVTTKQDKVNINKAIVATMVTKYNSRFLRRSGNGWVEITQHQAREKASHALRVQIIRSLGGGIVATSNDGKPLVYLEDVSHPTGMCPSVFTPQMQYDCDVSSTAASTSSLSSEKEPECTESDPPLLYQSQPDNVHTSTHDPESILFDDTPLNIHEAKMDLPLLEQALRLMLADGAPDESLHFRENRDNYNQSWSSVHSDLSEEEMSLLMPWLPGNRDWSGHS